MAVGKIRLATDKATSLENKLTQNSKTGALQQQAGKPAQQLAEEAYQKARTLALEGRYAEAIPVYRRAILINSTPEYNNHLAFALYELAKESKNYKMVQDCLLKAIEKYPTDAPLARNLGRIYELEGQLGNALEFYNRAIKSDPSDTELKEHLDKLREKIKK